MDPELTQRFDTLESAMARLAVAQTRTEEGLATLTERLATLTERMDGLTATVSVLASAQARTEERLGRLSDAVVRGFTLATERHGELVQRLDRLEDT